MTLTDRLRILVRLAFGGGTRVLAVVGKLVRETVRRDGIGIHNRSTTTSNHGPDATLSIENSELERSTGRSVKLLDVRLLLGQVTTEGSGPDLRKCVSTVR